MSILVSDILTGAYQLLGRPSQGDLPYLDLLEHVKDVARGKILDLKLAARNHTAIAGPWTTPSGREMLSSAFVGGAENFIPVKVEWRYLAASGSELLPNVAQVVAVEQLNELSHKAYTTETYVAFSDGFTSISFSETDTELSLREYRITYEDTDDLQITATTSTVELPALFVTLCKYEVALLCLDQIRNEKFTEERERLRQVFTAQFLAWNDRFRKFQTTLYGQKRVRKQGYRRTYR